MDTRLIIQTVQNTYGIAVVAIDLLRDGPDNTMWNIVDENGEKYVARVSKREMGNEIAFEAEWIRLLQGQGVPVVPIILTKENQPFTILESVYALTVFRFLQGKHLILSADSALSLTAVRAAAMALAKLHDASIKHAVDTSRRRTVFSELERIIEHRYLVTEKIPAGANFVVDVEAQLVWGKAQSYQSALVHNDYRAGNVMFDEQNNLVAILDFDWSCIGPAIKDVAHALAEWSFPDGAEGHNQEVFTAFLDGYNQRSITPISEDNVLYRWIALSCLSDACTFIIDRLIRGEVRDPASSYMYKKYKYFQSLNK